MELRTNDLRGVKPGTYAADSESGEKIIVIRRKEGWTIKRGAQGALKDKSFECTDYTEDGRQIETYYEH